MTERLRASLIAGGVWEREQHHRDESHLEAAGRLLPRRPRSVVVAVGTPEPGGWVPQPVQGTWVGNADSVHDSPPGLGVTDSM